MSKKKENQDEWLFTDLETEKFIRERITQLRLKKGLSESKLSEDIGQARNYCHQVVSGRIYPNIRPFFRLLKRLEVTPKDFFDTSLEDPSLVHEVYQEMCELPKDDLEMTLLFIRRLKNKEKPPADK